MRREILPRPVFRNEKGVGQLVRDDAGELGFRCQDGEGRGGRDLSRERLRSEDGDPVRVGLEEAREAVALGRDLGDRDDFEGRNVGQARRGKAVERAGGGVAGGLGEGAGVRGDGDVGAGAVHADRAGRCREEEKGGEEGATHGAGSGEGSPAKSPAGAPFAR